MGHRTLDTTSGLSGFRVSTLEDPGFGLLWVCLCESLMQISKFPKRGHFRVGLNSVVGVSNKMKLVIKVLGKNEEFAIGVPDAPVEVESLKMMLERNKGFPVNAQRILFKGKALLDSKTIQDYGITEGSKLHLSIKTTGDIARLSKDAGSSSKSDSSANDEGEFYKKLGKVLKKHFTDDDAEKIFSKFSESYAGMINALSLDDIERIAKYEIDKNKV